MKKRVGIIVTFLIVILFNLKVYAIEFNKTTNPPLNVVLEGNSDGIVFIPGNEPFLYKEAMVPGDIVKRTMIIKNDYDKPYEIYMRAERVTGIEKYDLLNKLKLTITYEGIVIYNGPASGEVNLLREDNLIKDISLGSVKPVETKTLYAEVTLDGDSVGNEYKNKVAQVDWIFTAINRESSKVPDTGDDKLLPYIILASLSIAFLLFINRKKLFKKNEK
ncbi:MAG: hypothetical protein ACRDA5_10855 [Clostridium sp.]